MDGHGKGKSKGKGKAAPPPPPSQEAKEAHKQAVAAKKAEAEAELRLMREAEQKQKDLVARLPTSKPCAIDSVPWETAEAVHHISGGGDKGGVQAVLLRGGKVVMVRKGADTASELVAQTVANSMGVRVAQFRLISGEDAEYGSMSDGLLRASPGARQAAKESAKVVNRARPPVAALEFVPGSTLDVALAGLASPSEEMFLAIGRLCAVDLLLNDMDRVPSPLWDNLVGNLTNVMVGPDGAVVGIDQQVNHIGDEDGMEEYLQRARKLVTHLMRRDFAHMAVKAFVEKAESAILTACNSLRNASDKRIKRIMTVSNVEVPPECWQALLNGMRDGLVRFERCWANGEMQAAMSSAAEELERLSGSEGRRAGENYAAFVQRIAETVAPLVCNEGQKSPR